MNVLALTGGIATGKSSALDVFRREVPEAAFFDCDESVRRLLGDSSVLEQLRRAFGSSIAPGGDLDRQKLREIVFGDSEKRRILEGILHPRVREECLEHLAEARKTSAAPLFLADVPLLFEGDFQFGQELALVVATSAATQRQRLAARDHFSEALISAILAAQLPILEKVQRADVVFWNEGPPIRLADQISLFLHSLIHS